jgi:hypothetical protein
MNLPEGEKMKMLGFLMSVILLAGVLAAAPPLGADAGVTGFKNGQAKELRVAGDGSGDFQTLAQALEAAMPGDVVVIRKSAGMVGLKLKQEAGGIVVEQAIPGSPAEAAGLKAGDILAAVDGQDVSGLPLEAVVARVRGKAGTRVILKVAPSGGSQRREVSIIRGDIRYPVRDDRDKLQIAWGEMDYAAALRWALPLAKGGDRDAQNTLGAMYYHGQGVAKDFGQALSWFRKAAEQGNVHAQNTLGAMHYHGQGVAKDFGEALPWLRKAGEQGHVYAQVTLGSMYYNGQGTAQDFEEALIWYRKAAVQGNAVAQHMVGFLYYAGRGVRKDFREAAAWFLKAAEQGDAVGQYMLGFLYEIGTGGIEKNSRVALAWYKKAAEQNYQPENRGSIPGDLWAEAIATRSERKPQAAPAASAGVSKDEIQSIIQAALKEKAERQAPAPKVLQSDVDKPGYRSVENPDHFAVVIGVENYASLPPAQFADRDAEAVRAHLIALGYPLRNIFFLGGQQATRAKIAQSVNTWLPNRVSGESTVFFYYSGHGAPDARTGRTYLVSADGDPEDLESTAYPLETLYAKLGGLKAKQVIVALDSCFSGAGGRSVLPKGARPLVLAVDMGTVPDKLVVLAASDKDQISGTIEAQGHGTFTYYLLKGLDGAARDGSGKVTVRSLYDYLLPRVRDAARLHNRDQVPQLLPAGGDRKASVVLR